MQKNCTQKQEEAVQQKDIHYIVNLHFNQKKNLIPLILVIFFLFFSSCFRKNEVQGIHLISTPLFEYKYQYLVVKDNYARTFSRPDSTKSVLSIFRKGSIHKLAEIGRTELSYTWYRIEESGLHYWIYAQEVILCTSFSQAMLYQKRL